MPSPAPKTSHLNGIDTEALEAALAGVEADPSQAAIAFRAKTRWQGGLSARTDIESWDLGGQRLVRRHQITSDEPIELLGQNTAPNPQDMILSALASCMTVGYVVGATTLGVRIDSLEIDTQCAFDLRGSFGLDPAIPPGAKRIQYTVRIKGSGTREQFEEIHQRVLATSPNYYHLSNPIVLDATLVVQT